MIRDPAIAKPLEAVQERQLARHIETLCALGPRPSGDGTATAGALAYLESELQKWGYQPRREPFGAYVRKWRRKVDTAGAVTFAMTMKSEVQHNLIVEKRGVTDAETVIELGAHYDTVPFGPGADDNTSGVAALLEVARLLADRSTAKTVRIVFFAMEEEGLVGSREHVRLLKRAGRLPEGLLSVDMIGYTSQAPGSQKIPTRIPLLFSPPDVGNFLLVAGNWSSGWLGELFEDCVETYVPELPYYSLNRLAGWFGDATRGDHFNYWQAGIPSVALVDGMNYRNPHYHKPTDTPDTLDLSFLRRNTQAILATTLEWAGVPPR